MYWHSNKVHFLSYFIYLFFFGRTNFKKYMYLEPPEFRIHIQSILCLKYCYLYKV